ncbi:major facilitator superfamily domain-containing protein [Dactylonectria estremocensis]|uniref:Major facilitator superfamily domain-containing protein n=1 Tax=Dactylonectria estremocensis TaxID=1079267 RepID=A0A9P9ERW3_9HYPO|nr:major facilitator superfamily domain-containing protein [Dactylonectria estremocensis]
MASPDHHGQIEKDTLDTSILSKHDLTLSADHEETVGSKVNSENAVASEQKLSKIIRRMDVIVLPIMTIVLAFCYIDRSNMGLAAVAGMAVELDFKGYQFSIALLVFFPGYALFVLPSNYILAKTSVRYWLTFLSIAFGLLSVGSGLIRNYGGLLAMRILLGMCEAGVYPTVIMVVSSWYPRYYFGKRMALVACGASLISSLSGVLAYAFSCINTPNYAGWRWIFILEGAITIVAAVICFFLIDEYPEKSRFLTEQQRNAAVRLISQDRQERNEETLTVWYVVQTFGDWKIWIFAFMYMLCVSATYGMAYFIPLILNGQMGFSGALSQVLTTPPYFYATILATGVSWFSDQHRIRAPFIIFLALNTILGISLTRWGPTTGSQYLGLFFAFGGSLVNGPMIIVFAQNNAPTRAKRSVSSGLQLTLGAVGGIIGSTVFRSQDAPTYTPGVITVLCGAGAIIGLSCLLVWQLHRLNRLHVETGLVLEGQQDFVYTL